jgi:Tfp pilus assembly protein PilO
LQTFTKKRMITGLIILLLLAGMYRFLYIPLSHKSVSVVKAINQKQAELNFFKKKVNRNRVKDLEKTLQENEQEEILFNKSVPNRLELSELYYVIDNIAAESTLKIKKIQIGTKKERFEKVKNTNYIQMNVEGEGSYSQVVKFLERVPTSTLLLQIEKVELNTVSPKNNSPFHFKITINAFEYTGVEK